MKKQSTITPEQKRYLRRLRLKKFFLYLAWLASAVAIFMMSYSVFDIDNEERINPQIDRAIVQIAKLLPQMEQNEAALRDAYDKMLESWEDVLGASNISSKKMDASIEKMVGDTLSWLNRITKLKVGRNGMVAVVSKEDGRIVAHPDKNMVGGEFLILADNDGIIPVEAVNTSDSDGSLNFRHAMMLPHSFSEMSSRLDLVLQSISYGIYGSILSYNDYYILCGIPAKDFIISILGSASLITLIYLVLMWLFVKWICLVMNTHKESFKTMRNKLFSYTVLLCAIFFGVTFYLQRLSSVTENLKTMSKHADLAVDTLNSYEEQRSKLGELLDSFYLVQCQIAAGLIEEKGVENLTWKDMQRYADQLQVKYVYLFDKDGNVVVTNSPYDHLEISTDPENYTYQFRKVLDGVDQVVLTPIKDEWRNEYLQYIALNLRDENNASNGFVLIGVDPELRDNLLSPLNVDTILENLVIGLPDAAIAVDKETSKIAATTGIGYKGSSIEELGLTQDMLLNDFSGFLKIQGTEYYAGVSTSSKYYVITLMQRPGSLGSLLISLKVTLVMLGSLFLIIALTLIRYQRLVIDEVPDEEIPSEEAPEAKNVLGEASKGLFTGLSGLIRTQEKKGLEDRWGVIVSKDRLTPGKRITRIIYWLLLLFCLIILLPTLRESLDGRYDPNELSDLAYVIAGSWQKGVNIFAFTICVFLLCAMFVIVVLLNRILYRIAKISDMRVETICLLIKNAIKYICVIVFVYYGLAQFGVQTQTLLASAGILSMMISFGAKDLVSDIIAGFFTIIEGTYKVGDFITVGGWSGTVIEIGLRTTKIRLFAETKILNNSSIRDIINTDGEITTLALNVPISYDADLMEVETILAEELPGLLDAIPGLVEVPSYDGVDSLGESGVNLRISIRVKISSRVPALRCLRREIKLLFDRRGIEIPYNQLVLHNAADAGIKTDQDKQQMEDRP